jgi:hypothetical protein
MRRSLQIATAGMRPIAQKTADDRLRSVIANVLMQAHKVQLGFAAWLNSMTSVRIPLLNRGGGRAQLPTCHGA